MPGLAFPWSSKIKAVRLIWGNSSVVERPGFNSRFFWYFSYKSPLRAQVL